MSGGSNSVGFSTVSLTSTGQKTLAEGSTQGVPQAAKGLILTVEAGACRIRFDNSTTVVSTGVGNGTLLNNNDVFVLDSWSVPKTNWRQAMLSLRMIADVAGSTSNVEVHYMD